MRVLVTGGAGFVGSAVVERLVDRGDRVVVLDDLSRSRREAVHPEALFAEGSVGDHALVEALVTPGTSVIEKVKEIVSAAPGIYGDVDAGLDNQANRERFAAEAVSKLGTAAVQRFMPLTSGEVPDDTE